MSDMHPGNPSNSKNPPVRPTRQKMAPVVTNVRVRRRSFLSRFSDRSSTIWRDVVKEVVIPYTQDLFSASMHSIIDRATYADARPGGTYRGANGSRNPQHITGTGYVVTDYAGQYQGAAHTPQQLSYDPSHRPFDFSIYEFADYGSGRELIDRLMHQVHSYHRATVNDLLDLLGKSTTVDHTGENYGWDNIEDIQNASIRRARRGGGYYLEIVDAKPLKK